MNYEPEEDGQVKWIELKVTLGVVAMVIALAAYVWSSGGWG